MKPISELLRRKQISTFLVLPLLSALQACTLQTDSLNNAHNNNQATANISVPLSAITSPSPYAKNIPIDTQLSLTFDFVPTLGLNRSVRIYRINGNTKDKELIDSISLNGESDELGYVGQSLVRIVNTQPIWITDNILHIALHSNKLNYNAEYFVEVDADLVSGQLNNKNFKGLGVEDSWFFTTKSSAPTDGNIIVDDNGNADFRTIQGALDYVMENISADTPSTISIKNGNYHELLYLREKNNIELIGESREKTIISYENFERFNRGTGRSTPSNQESKGGRSLFLVEDVDMLTINNLTIHNLHRRTNGRGDQAETIYFNSGHRLIAKNSTFISEQDTLQLKGYTWFYNTLVAGNVDFIWGYSVASLFENSEIRSLGDSKDNAKGSGGYILQARTRNIDHPGFVFLNSSLTQAPGPLGNVIGKGKTYLGRSSGYASMFDNIVFVNCKMDSHIAAVGWSPQKAANPSPPTNNAGWREYGSMDLSGAPLNLNARSGAYTLTKTEALAYEDRAKVFASYNNGNGWNPKP